MLKKRVITTAVLLPLALVIIWFGEPWFTILIAITGLLAFHEFCKLVAASKALPLTYFGLIWTLLFILSPHLDYSFTTPILLSSALIVSLVWLLLRPEKEKAFSGWVWTIAGILYVGWLLSYLVALRGLEDGRDWVFFVLLTNASSDSAAYFIGKAWGRHRLATNISPNKTWEGTIAGALGAVVMGVVLVTFLELPIGYGGAILLSFLVSVFGQLGDLAESLFKRDIGVKESSQLLPGHGGFLDRIDSVVFASVVVYYYVIWVI